MYLGWLNKGSWSKLFKFWSGLGRNILTSPIRISILQDSKQYNHLKSFWNFFYKSIFLIICSFWWQFSVMIWKNNSKICNSGLNKETKNSAADLSNRFDFLKPPQPILYGPAVNIPHISIGGRKLFPVYSACSRAPPPPPLMFRTEGFLYYTHCQAASS